MPRAPKPDELSELEQSVPYLHLYLLLQQVERGFRHALDNVLNKGNTRGIDYDMALILLALLQRGEATVNQLQDDVGRDLSLVSRDLSALGKLRLVNKFRSEIDGRIHLVRLSRKGKAAATEVQESLSYALEVLVKDLRPIEEEELEFLLHTLLKTQSNLRRVEPNSGLEGLLPKPPGSSSSP